MAQSGSNVLVTCRSSAMQDPAQPKLASHGPPLDAQVMQREKPSREGFSALCQNGFPRSTTIVCSGAAVTHAVSDTVKEVVEGGELRWYREAFEARKRMVSASRNELLLRIHNRKQAIRKRKTHRFGWVRLLTIRLL